MGASVSSAAAVRAWTANDVAARVAGLGSAFEKYEAAIKENGVDDETFEKLRAMVKEGGKGKR